MKSLVPFVLLYSIYHKIVAQNPSDVIYFRLKKELVTNNGLVLWQNTTAR